MIRRVFTFIKENILGIKPIFKIKIEKCWWGHDYVNIKFSKDNGWSWKYIVGQYFNAWSEYDGDMVDTKSFTVNEVEYVLRELKTYEDCITYNNKIYKKVKEHNDWKKEQYYSKINKRKELIDKYNK